MATAVTTRATTKKKSGKGLLSGRGKIDRTFLFLVLILNVIGLMMLYSASHAYAYYRFNDSFYYIGDQLMFAAVGVVGMLFIAYFIEYKLIKNLAWVIYGTSIVMLALTLVMPAYNNAHRWITVGGVTFQSSEFTKFAVVVIFAFFIEKYQSQIKTFKYGVLPFALTVGPVLGIMVFQPHLSGIVIIFAIAVTLMFIGGTDIRWFMLGLTLVALALLYIVFFTDLISYATERISTWLDPFSDPSDSGWQTIQSLLSIGSGGLMGLGYGNSRQKHMYVSEPQNDFIFAIVCEELGFIGATIILLLFAMLVWRGFIIAFSCKDKFSAMLVIGLTLQLGYQVILNIAVVTNTLPNTGIGLPFFSAGGTALLMQLFQMGVILSISRHATLKKE